MLEEQRIRMDDLENATPTELEAAEVSRRETVDKWLEEYGAAGRLPSPKEIDGRDADDAVSVVNVAMWEVEGLVVEADAGAQLHALVGDWGKAAIACIRAKANKKATAAA
jgi:hypothetical protein